MADKDTVSPYDDEVADPYAADDTKSPHDPAAAKTRTGTGNGNGKPAPRKATRTTKTVKKT